MKPVYCCNSKSYENYYLSQVGSGGPYYSGAQFQRGYGLSNIFSSIGKTILPLLKTTAKTVGRQALKSGVAFASDVINGQNAKQAAINRAKEAGSTLLNNAIRKRKKMPKKVQKKRRKKHNDIFS